MTAEIKNMTAEIFETGDFYAIIDHLKAHEHGPSDVIVSTYSGGYVTLVQDPIKQTKGSWGKVQMAGSMEEVRKKLGSNAYSNVLLSSYTGGYVFAVFSPSKKVAPITT